MRITLLGCGSSAGVPLIGCTCSICHSTDARNKRSRVSLRVEAQGQSLLIDTSPDLRLQALQHHMPIVNAILYTHDHADHTHGIDDVRSFNFTCNDVIPAYGDAETLNHLQKRFAYAFKEKPENVWFRPCMRPHVVTPYHPFDVQGVQVLPFAQLHGKVQSLGYRIGDMAYSTDVNVMPEESFAALEGVKLWVVDCLRYTPSYTHAHLALTLEWISRVKPERAILTHMAHDFDYATLAAELPAGVEPGYDGLVVEL